MAVLYSENDPYAAQWLRNLIKADLIAPGYVDERDIRELEPSDLDGYTQFHAFAGIGGWSLALRLAGFPDDRPVFTGSCPCQPFSYAARGRNKRFDSRGHLWPIWRSLIQAARPDLVFGEQVANAKDWIDQVWLDLESDGYAVGAAAIPAFAVGADHIRERIWFFGYANGQSKPGVPFDDEMAWVQRNCREPRGVVPTDGIPDRMASMRAFGNAIVPQVAAEFIGAFLDAERAMLT